MKKNKGVPGFELATYLHAHQQQACTLLHTCVACFVFFWLGCCPLLYVRTSYVSRDPVSYIVSAYQGTWYHTVFSCDNNSVFTTLH